MSSLVKMAIDDWCTVFSDPIFELWFKKEYYK